MGFCPVCNGIEKANYQCSHCQSYMNDKGRLIDYFDDYSAYESIDLMKEIDGIANDKKDGKCPHLLVCENCHSDRVVLISEDI